MRSPSNVLRMLACLLAAVALPSLSLASEVDPTPVEKPAGDAIRARFEALRQRIFDRLGEPGVAADLYQLEELAQLGGSLERTADILYRVAGSRSARPEVKALAHRILADVERQRGRLPRVASNLEAIGAVTEVAIAGPFDNENKGGFDVAYGPELELDLSKKWPALRGETGFRVVEGLGRTGTLALWEAVRPTQEVVVYALAILDAPSETGAAIHLGAPGATKAWLNGTPILADPAYHPARFDQNTVPVRLKRGENVLLLKIAAGQGERLGLELRVTGSDGGPIRGLRVAAPSEGSWKAPTPIPAGRKILARSPLLESLARVAEAKGSPRALYDFARVLGERHPFDEAEKRDVKAAEKAARAAPGDVDAQLLAARYHRDDANERRSWLEKAVAVERPGEARAHVALADHWLDRGDAHRALQILDPRLEQAPGDWTAHILYARALTAQGMQARAINVLRELAARFRDEPVILETLASHHRRDGQTDESMRLLRVALALRPAHQGAASTLASALVERGQIEEANQVLANAERLAPLDAGLLLRRADLLAANGRVDEAKILYGRAAAISPQDGEVFSRHGETLLREGDTDGALAHFQRALAVEPQNARLKELVRSLKPGEASFARPFLHDLREAAKLAEGKYDGEDAAKLVDLNVVRVLPSGQASRTVQTITRVQSQRGVDRFRSFPIRYAPEREELQVERARILKPDGSIIDTHSENVRSMNEPWSGLYYDARALVVGFPALAPGDVVELVYRVDDVARDNLLGDYFGDVSYVQEDLPVAAWEYVLEMPAGRKIFFNQLERAAYEEKPSADGRTLHRWVAKDVPEIVPEAGMPGWAEVADYLHVSTYQDWESVARFWWGLIRDQVEPTPEIQRVAEEVVRGIPADDVPGRVRAIYNYVVTKTRYVGLEFGIHSFKPYKVEQILRRRFGDCKDKASLTYAMLKSVGIDSRLVLLRMRNLGQIGGEPASLAIFNHAVLYVPQLDLFLDGTAEWSGSRELPEADRGAEVLIVDPTGKSEFRVTPEAPAALSTTAAEHQVILEADGTAKLLGTTRIAGLPAPNVRRAYASPNGRKASFEQAWARTYPGVSVASLQVSDTTRLEDDVKLDFQLHVPDYATKRPDGRLSFTPFGAGGSSYVESFAPLSARRYDLVLRHAWTNTFRHEFRLPKGYSVGRLPEAATLSSPFGEVEVAYAEQDGKVIVTGKVVMASPRVRPADYPAFRSFLGQADAILAREVVLAPPGT